MSSVSKRTQYIIVAVAIAALIPIVLLFLRARTAREPDFRVALVGFLAADEIAFEDAGAELGVKVDSLSLAEFFAPQKKPVHYDAAIFRTMRMRLENATPEAVARLDSCDATLFYPSTNDQFSRFNKLPETLEPAVFDPYLMTPTRQNAYAVLALFKRALAGATIDVPDPEELPTFGFYYRGTEVSPTLDDWLKRDDIPALPDSAPRVALVGPFLNPFKSADAKPLEAIVTAFADRGLRAVPIYGVRANPESLAEVAPELVVVFPLGRLLPDDAAPELFARVDCPVLTAISLSVPRKVWESEPVGMTATYQNLAVALPELDGSIAPTPVSTSEEDDEGREVRVPIQDRIERMADRAANMIALRHKPNAQKRLAIFYRRGAGAAAITAQSLDAVPSLYNTLVALKAQGYDLGDSFPETEEEFAAILDKRGRLIGQWAPGAFQTFLTEGAPERVATTDYNAWFERDIPEAARKETLKVWGPAPGACFTGQTESGDSFIAVSRVQFGNVVLMPQPTTEIVADDPRASDFNSVHGTNKATPHFYNAAYLWVREGFKADAILHFGTHGSLEFTRGKPLMLSENDWPDALIGAVPDFYVYSINNVGEGLLAKRRIYATLVSHTTPPFIDAAPTDENVALTGALDAFEATQDEAVRAETLVEIERLAKESGLTPYEHDAAHEGHDAEDGDGHDPDEERVEFYREQLHRLAETSVTDGLHVIGRPWTEEQLTATANAIGTPDALERLRESTNGLELERLIAALDGRFVPASTGGDPLVNPDSLPTGRNMSGTNIEQTPDTATFKLAQKLTDELIADFLAKNGRYPERIAVTLWGGEYIRTRGLTVAQALWAMGVRPVYDKRGSLRDLEVVPEEELGRPRIDILIQTSGQFRDAAPSRIELLDRAVRMAAVPEGEAFPNYVREHTRATAQTLMERGYVEEEAAELSTARVFGAAKALDYGTGIRKLVERSDKWEEKSEIADQYLINMGGIYRNAKVWGVPIEGLLESNLKGTDVVLQSRSSNTWGPVKLDHLYEFGTIETVVREKTGVEPTFLLSDGRRPKNTRTQTLDEAIRDEMQTTFWNRRWLEGLMREKGGSGAATFAKATQNLFGWSAVGSQGLVDDATWRKTVETFVDDRLEIGVRQYMEETNPAALAETTAVALDAARKNFWNPTPEEKRKLAETLAETVKKHGAPCSYNVCGNVKLRDFVAENLPDDAAQEYRDAIDAAARDATTDAQVSGMELVETKREEETQDADDPDAVPQRDVPPVGAPLRVAIVLVALAIVALGFGLGGRRKRR